MFAEVGDDVDESPEILVEETPIAHTHPVVDQQTWLATTSPLPVVPSSTRNSLSPPFKKQKR